MDIGHNTNSLMLAQVKRCTYVEQHIGSLEVNSSKEQVNSFKNKTKIMLRPIKQKIKYYYIFTIYYNNKNQRVALCAPMKISRTQ